jgi:hypothetical protein
MKKNDENSKSLKDMTQSDEPVTYTTGAGSGPNDCMTPEFYDVLCKNGALKSAVYVCGIGWTLPEVSVTGSSSDSGSDSGSGSGSSTGCGSDVFGSGSGSDTGSDLVQVAVPAQVVALQR